MQLGVRRRLAQRRRREDEETRRTSHTRRSAQNDRHYLGDFNVLCEFCGALHWMAEKLTKSTTTSPRFGMCCRQGNISVPLLRNPPPVLRRLFEEEDGRSREFRDHIRQYNVALQFTSLGAQIERSLMQEGRGVYCFKILGELRHRMGALCPNDENDFSYAQLYVYDRDVALNARMRRNSNLTHSTMGDLQECLLQNHAFCPTFRHARDILEEARANGASTEDLYAHLHIEVDCDRRRYNLPTSDEVSVIIPGNGERAEGMRDIVLRMREGPLIQIHECNPAYMPLHYVLLFPYGELGWYDGMTHVDGCRRITLREHHAFRLFQRNTEYSLILRGGKLFQEYVVDVVAANEQNNLRWVETHQPTVRAELYQGLFDEVQNNDMGLRDLGQRIILPSSFQGSARNLYERYLDSMAIARFHGHPDVFGTMTANPNWVEIRNALLPGQHSSDRPDLVTRVFELKRKAMMEDIEKNKVLGDVKARVHTNEFQKRGLPHTHFLLFLALKIKDVSDVDRIVRAEIPNPQEEPELFETVMTCMIHGPCGPGYPNAPCMEKGVCSKGYPKAFQENTTMEMNGYPLYRRRDDGRRYHHSGRVDGGFYVTNKDVVPYNGLLLKKYNCHFIMEVCASVRAIKYIQKYIYKGHDRALMMIGNERNEIKQYRNGRWLGPHEAMFHLLEFGMHEEVPNVVRLPLHLPGQHMVVYRPDEHPLRVLERAQSEITMLTMFLKVCAESEYARQFTYQEFPHYFVWDKSEKCWRRRQKGDAIGRIYFCDPRAGESYYLRLLLSRVRGPVSFEDLRSGLPTFKEACLARGYLEDDDEWIQCLEEALLWKTGRQLRALFAMILLKNHPNDPHLLWDRFREHLCDDLIYRLINEHYIIPTSSQVYDYGLYLLDEILWASGKSLIDFSPMPLWETDWSEHAGNRLVAEQLAYDRDELRDLSATRAESLNEDQQAIYERVVESVENQHGHRFFLEGQGGSGKTYVYNVIAMRVRSEGKIVLCVASSGIAALLLVGGKTTHSTFGIPVRNLNEDSMCNVRKNTDRGALFQKVELVVWDEAPMQHRYYIEAVDRSLRDVRDSDKPFGGVTMLFGGDFRQVLPVVPKGTREQTVDASIQKSNLWRDMEVYRLRRNIRLECLNDEDHEFAGELLNIGDGTSIIDPVKKLVSLPRHMQVDSTTSSLIDNIYRGLNDRGAMFDDLYWRDCSILSPRNVDVHFINDLALNLFSEDCREYYSVDEVDQVEDAEEGRNIRNVYPVEYLNSLTPSGFPPARLRLAVGCPIMVLRNIAPLQGLCNGSRLVVTQLSNRVIEARILAGDHTGETVLIPRITLVTDPLEMAFTLKRRQFPIRVAFAMTINKSQGQSLKTVGVDLTSPVFNHGQLYVALSRCTSPRYIKVLYLERTSETTVAENTTVNIVYPEILLG